MLGLQFGFEFEFGLGRRRTLKKGWGLSQEELKKSWELSHEELKKSWELFQEALKKGWELSQDENSRSVGNFPKKERVHDDL